MSTYGYLAKASLYRQRRVNTRKGKKGKRPYIKPKECKERVKAIEAILKKLDKSDV